MQRVAKRCRKSWCVIRSTPTLLHARSSAFCDSRTVTPSEGRPFRYTGYVAGGRAFDALAVVAPDDPSAHGWYVFPEMTPDEVVAFRTYDTELVRDGKTHFTPHSAFRDPDVEIGKPARFSIELRVMCLFR